MRVSTGNSGFFCVLSLLALALIAINPLNCFRQTHRAHGMELGPASEADREFCFRLNEACFRQRIEEIRGWDEVVERPDATSQFRGRRGFYCRA
jgi:hypothetical protein